jgi:hypothetical protein
MSDSSGAATLGGIFLILAEEPEKNRTLAERIWDGPARQVDCCWQQMGIDGALEKLGLIHRGPDDEDGQVWLARGED